MLARYYHSATGRFLSEDPAFLAVGTPNLKQLTGLELFAYLSNPQVLNAYSYTINNPLKYIDEGGEFFGEPGRALASSQRDIANFLKQAADYTSNQGGFINLVAGFVTHAVADVVSNTANVYDPDAGAVTRATSLGLVALDVGTGGRGSSAAQITKQFGRSLTVDAVKQSRHILGTGYQIGKSILTHPDPQKLINEFAGTGQKLFNQGWLQKEVVDFGQTIGRYIETSTGKALETTRGTIHYGKSGSHLVPAPPKILHD